MASAIMDNAYNYFLTTYGHNTISRYDVHKKSELRHTYNSIVKINKESPLYKIKDTGDIDKYAIDIKENAQRIKKAIASLSDGDGGIENAFRKKIAVSDQSDIVDVNYVGNGNENDNDTNFTVEVKQLATPQTNLGNFLQDNHQDILPGSYSFDLSTNSNSYEFQYNVNPGDTNRSVLDKLSSLVNSSGIGLTASIVTDTNEMSALKIESRQTGLGPDEQIKFHIAPDGSNLSKAAMATLGIDKVAAPAHNSKFLLNGKERSSRANTFTINNTFELNMKGISEDDHPATIGYKPNIDAVVDQIGDLITSYNKMLDIASSYSIRQQHSSRIISDIGGVANQFRNTFERMGLNIGDRGVISIDRDQLKEAIGEPNPSDSINELNKFKDALKSKADKISLNPMNYVNSIMVAYKNPGHNFATPYITSIYSGMMLDQYC